MGQVGVGDTCSGHARAALVGLLLHARGCSGGPRRRFLLLARPAADSAALDRINFPMMVPVGSLSQDMSPRSVQRAASDAGMGVDAQMIIANKPQENHGNEVEGSSGAHGGFEAEVWEDKYDQSCGSGGGGGCRTLWEEKELSISVDDYLSK
ncbi:hypothetical protein ACOSP7_009154 [Xanthoceras sorbifolium]